MVYPTPAPACGSQLPTEVVEPTCKMSSGLIVVMVGDICQGKEASQGVVT
jgi:hypothetical protein